MATNTYLLPSMVSNKGPIMLNNNLIKQSVDWNVLYFFNSRPHVDRLSSQLTFFIGFNKCFKKFSSMMFKESFFHLSKCP
jgi:hypothetical protein